MRRDDEHQQRQAEQKRDPAVERCPERDNSGTHSLPAISSNTQGEPMLVPIALGCLLSILTIGIHSIGTLGGIRLLRRFSKSGHKTLGIVRLIMTLCLSALYLLVLHFLDALCWAFVYFFVSVMPDMEEAIYFSLVTFSSLGFGDVVIRTHYRMLAAIEAMNGLLILGWSTALFMMTVQRLWEAYEGRVKP